MKKVCLFQQKNSAARSRAIRNSTLRDKAAKNMVSENRTSENRTSENEATETRVAINKIAKISSRLKYCTLLVQLDLRINTLNKISFREFVSSMH